MRRTTITRTAIVAIGVFGLMPPAPAVEKPTTAPVTLPATQASSVTCDPEVRELIPLIRQGEELYTKMQGDMEVKGVFKLQNDDPHPGPRMIRRLEQSFTLIRQGSCSFIDTRMSDTTQSRQSESTQQLVSDSKIWRLLLTRSIDNYREAAVLDTAFPVFLFQSDPFRMFSLSQADLISEWLQNGMSFGENRRQRISRIADADCLGRRCVRLQLQVTAVGLADDMANPTVTLWLCPELHYLPLKLESVADDAFMKKHPGVDASMVMSVLGLQEIAPGIFYPTEVHFGMAGSSRHWAFQSVKLHPNYPAEKFAELTVPDGTELKVFYRKKVIAHGKTDDQWNMDTAAALLADTILNDSPTTAPTTQESSHGQQPIH